MASPWKAWATPGAGTSTSLALASGAGSTRGLRLAYSFACTVGNSDCGQHAMAIRDFAEVQGLPAAVQFMTRSPSSAVLKLRVIDGSGQTLQYAVARAPQGFDPTVWYAATVDLAKPLEFWGGARSGRVETGIRSLRLLVSTKTGKAESGAIEFDDLSLLDSLPVARTKVFVNGVLSVDDFEDRPVVQPWSVWATTGTGTSASIASQAGYASSRGMRINYAFACLVAGRDCGQYAQATLNLPAPLGPGAALRFMTRSPSSAQLVVRVVDQAGQTLQYAVSRPPAGYVAGAWYEGVVDLAKPSEYWGGGASGRVEQGIRSVRLLVSTRTGRAEAGIAEFDEIELLESMPIPAAKVAVNGVLTIDDFEDRSVVKPWSVWATAAAGTSASLATQTGYASARGMRVNYAFSCLVANSDCGQHAMATLKLPVALAPGAALRFMTRSPVSARLVVRIIDQGGQTLQYAVPRSTLGYDPTAWYAAVVNLAKPLEYWGGAASGRIEGGIASVRLLVSTKTGTAQSGTVEIDELVLLDALPPATVPVAVNGVLNIDNFEDRLVVQPWTAWATTATGTRGAIASQGGYASSRGMRLDYGFACLRAGSDCGQFAVATLPLPIVLPPGAALSFMTRSPISAKVSLRVIDDSGQTLQYRIVRPLAGYDPSVWYQAVAELAKPELYWGGANTGRIQGGIRKVQVMVSSTVGTAVSGSVQIDNVSMLQSLPPSSIALAAGRATIDSFDNRDASGPWSFVAGDARSVGTLSAVAGPESVRALSLNYDFSCVGSDCGKYVLGQLGLPTPVEAGAAIAFWLRSPGNVTTALRVIDATGETLQYNVERTLEGAVENRWYRALVSLAAPDQHWGGDGNGVVDGPIRGIAIAANNAFGLPAKGSVGIDQLEMRADINTTHRLVRAGSTLLPAAVDRSIGSRFGVAHHAGASDESLDAARAIGMSALRIDLFWARVERNGVLDFSEFDAVIGGIAARNLEAVLILDYSHEDHDVRTPAGIAAYSRFAAEAVRRYGGGLVSFEIWNEPNHAPYWHGAPNATQYAALCRAAIQAIRAVAPDATVITGGLSHFDFPYLKSMLLAGAADQADAVALHAYSKPEGLAEKWVLAKRLIVETTALDLPIWLTEWGFSVGTVDGDSNAASLAFLERQAALVTRSMLTHWALGAEVSIAYKLMNSGEDVLAREDNFGLLDKWLADKPAAQAVRTFMRMAGAKTSLGLAADTPPGLHLWVLDGPAETVYVAWQSETDRSALLELPRSGLTEVADFLGRGGMPAASADNPALSRLRLQETDGPVFIRYAK